MASLSMSSRSSVDRAPARCPGGHGFNSYPGLRFFLCPTLVIHLFSQYFYSHNIFAFIPRGVEHGTLFFDMPHCMNGELCLELVKEILYTVQFHLLLISKFIVCLFCLVTTKLKPLPSVNY